MSPTSGTTSILSIQSSVAYGHAGNSAATFPLMRMGVEVWPVLTVHFSNHTGYGAWRGPLLAAADVAEVIAGIDDRGVLGRCDAVLSGYQGAEDIGAVVLEAVATVRERNPDAVYCCDPVMGDVGRGFFVRPGIPEFMRDHVVPDADIITPNQFELEWLAGREVTTLPELLAAVEAIRAVGPQVVLITSAQVDSTPTDTVQMVLVTPDGAWQVTTPLLPLAVNGCGDVTTAVFLARWLATGDPVASLEHTAAAVFGLLSATAAAGSSELSLVAAQDEFVIPTHHFPVSPLS